MVKRSNFHFCNWAAMAMALGALWLPARVLPAQQPRLSATLSATLRGEVTDHAGEVCEGAQVELRVAGAPVRSAISDSVGEFSFDQVAAGKFEIRVTAIGFGPQTVRGTVVAGQTLALPAIVLRPTSTGEVRVSADPVEVATEELHDEEKQRVLGIVPNFNVIYDHNAPPLSTRQKYQLSTRTLIDPFTILTDGGTAGLDQANGDFQNLGNGPAGYLRRFGVVYGDDVMGTMLGDAVFPVLLHQDPRYFWKGTGTKTSRLFYAIAASVICKGDNGRWQPNYSIFAADMTVAGIGEAYYPANDRSASAAIAESVGLSELSDVVQNIFQEFVARHFTRKAPTYSNTK